MKNLKIYLLLILPSLFFLSSINAQVLISNSSGIPNESAMLQIDSDTKGVLIPRVTTTNREKITGVPGLLVFDTDKGSFYLYGNTDWIDLSSSAGIWTQNASNVYLTNTTKNIGVGTSTPKSNFVIKGVAGDGADDVLFEVQDNFGKAIFRVTSEGVRVYVKDKSKGISGGFAVGQYGSLKTEGDEFFVVTPFQTRVNTLPGSKGKSGGFAVGQYGSLKNGPITTNFYTNPSETRIYTDKAAKSKAVSGGFAVGQYGSLKADGDKYMHIEDDNIFIGNLAGVLTYDNGGVNNVFIGNNAGAANTNGNGNIFIGNNAGSTVLDNNKLFIDNASSSSDIALIYGDFTSKAVNLNGSLRFNAGSSNTITMPTSRGATDQVLTSNSGGIATWETVTDLFTFPTPPVQYIPPTIRVTYDPEFNFQEEDNIGTLIVKTEDKQMDVFLPFVEKSLDRVIKIKNSRPVGNIDLYTVGGDIIDGVSELPFFISPGETYTFQATINNDKGTWFIIDYTSEVLENLNLFLKVTDVDYDFEKDSEGSKVATLILNADGIKAILPPANLYPNRTIVIKNSEIVDKGNDILPAEGSGDNIDGQANLQIMTPNKSYTLQSDGVNTWYVINSY